MASNKVELWSLDHFFGCIVPCQTGIVWSNQTGGTHCDHPEVEGLYVPLPFHWLPEVDPLYDEWIWHTEANCVQDVTKFLAGGPEDLRFFFAPPENWTDSYGEAWIPVTIKDFSLPAYHGSLLSSFAGKTAILTYQNSD